MTAYGRFVVVPARAAAYLVLGARAVRLRERSASLAPELRAELVDVLDGLEQAAADTRTSTISRERKDETVVGEMPADSWCSIADAAALLGLGRRRVQQLAIGGELVGRKVGRGWLVERAAVDLLAQERREREAS